MWGEGGRTWVAAMSARSLPLMPTEHFCFVSDLSVARARSQKKTRKNTGTAHSRGKRRAAAWFSRYIMYTQKAKKWQPAARFNRHCNKTR